MNDTPVTQSNMQAVYTTAFQTALQTAGWSRTQIEVTWNDDEQAPEALVDLSPGKVRIRAVVEDGQVVGFVPTTIRRPGIASAQLLTAELAQRDINLSRFLYTGTRRGYVVR